MDLKKESRRAFPSGGTISCRVVKGSVAGWRIRIGAHSDDLVAADSLKRMHEVCKVVTLGSGETKVVSPYGGLVFFESPANCGEIEVNQRVSTLSVLRLFIRLTNSKRWY